MDKYKKTRDKWRKNNPDKIKAIYKKYREKRKSLGLCVCCKNPAFENKVLCADCIWKKQAKRFDIPVKTLDIIFEQQNGKCALSGRILIKGKNASIDHIVPKSRGGTNDIENIRLLDLDINKFKNFWLDEEIFQIIKEIILHKYS